MTTKNEAYGLANALETVCSDFAEDHDTAVEGAVLIRALIDQLAAAEAKIAQVQEWRSQKDPVFYDLDAILSTSPVSALDAVRADD